MIDNNTQSNLKFAWHIVAARATGTGHRNSGKDCEDYHKTESLPGNIHVLAVADGAGSAARAAEGARIAVQTALDAVVQSYTNNQALDREDGWTALLLGGQRSICYRETGHRFDE